MLSSLDAASHMLMRVFAVVWIIVVIAHIGILTYFARAHALVFTACKLQYKG